jgi:C1A family cysteine protease
MIHCLSDGFPFVLGISVYDSFMTQKVATTGIVEMPARTENLLGGHAVMAVGFDQATRRFIIRNSWGVDWGMKGYFTIPFDYLSNGNLADDF